MTTTTATTTTVEIHIPIQEMEESTSTLHQLLPTTTNDGTGSNNNTSTIINRIKSMFCSCIASPPPLKLRSMVSSSVMNHKPIELDNLAPDSIHNSGSDIDYPVLISNDDYYEFCNQMNTYIQQYDVIVHRRKRMEYYQLATIKILFLISIQLFIIEYSKMMNNNEMTILRFILLCLRYIGYSILVIIIHSMIYVYFTYTPLQNVKNETFRMYLNVNKLCADTSFHRLVLVAKPTTISMPSSSILASSPPLSSTSSILRTPVKVTFQMVLKFDVGMSGKYSIMDSIQIIIVKTITTTTTSCNDSKTIVTTGTTTTAAAQSSSPTNTNSTTSSITTTSEQGVSTTTTTTTTTTTVTTTTTTTTQDGTIQHPYSSTAINNDVNDILYSDQNAESQLSQQPKNHPLRTDIESTNDYVSILDIV